MIKYNIKKETIPILLIVFAIIFSGITYNLLPDKVVSHWNFYGTADGWSSKNFQAMFFPGLILFMYILFLILPRIDPRRDRYKEFEKVYSIFKLVILSFFFILFIATTLYNLGYNMNIGKLISFLVGVMMIVLGNYMDKIKRNWFVGIKNPWTLSSESVWNKTHRFAKWVFMIFGICIITAPYLSIFYGTGLFILGIFLTVFGTMIYSYIIYKKERKNI